MNYDLESRTKKFSIGVIDICKKIKPTPVNRNLISQVIRSATSIGANYREANGASSKNDFRNKVFICKKEAQETEYWLDLCIHAELEHTKELQLLREECRQITLIFGKIAGSLKYKV